MNHLSSKNVNPPVRLVGLATAQQEELLRVVHGQLGHHGQPDVLERGAVGGVLNPRSSPAGGVTIDQPLRQPQATLPLAPTMPISIEVEYADRVNLAMHQNGVSLVERVLLTNTGDTAIEGLALEMSLENDECEPWTVRIERIDPGATYNIEPEDLRLNASALARRTEAERSRSSPVRDGLGSASRLSEHSNAARRTEESFAASACSAISVPSRDLASARRSRTATRRVMERDPSAFAASFHPFATRNAAVFRTMARA